MAKVIYLDLKSGFRIVQWADNSTQLNDLKGDCFNPGVIKDIELIKLKAEELGFEEKVESLGVYGFTLEKWNGNINKGWEHFDSCGGFVGEYNSSGNACADTLHYIVDEMKETIAIEAA